MTVSSTLSDVVQKMGNDTVTDNSTLGWDVVVNYAYVWRSKLQDVPTDHCVFTAKMRSTNYSTTLIKTTPTEMLKS